MFAYYVGIYCISAFQLLLLSYWGHRVLEESQAVADVCYQIDFVGSDTRFQKGLQLMIERSQRPIYFTAGKFSQVTLSNFVSVRRPFYVSN